MVRRVLTVAGSDSGGGAGIQADLKVMTAHSVYGLSVVTAITSQNTQGVDAVQVTSPDLVEKQFRAVVSDIGCDVVKTGMLGNKETVALLVRLLQEYSLIKLVVDPVMVATTGATLLERDAVETILHSLLPRASILTPNVPEARLLLATSRGVALEELPEPTNIQDLKDMAIELQKLGPQFVLVKGGHLPLDKDMQTCTTLESRAFVADVLHGNDTTTVLVSAWSPSRNVHGTGCSLASAIACNIANEQDIIEAVRNAIGYIHGAITESFDLGSGSGPLNHMHRIQALPFNKGEFIDYLIHHPDVQPAWQAYTRHDFVLQLADGTLPSSAFKHFLKQDYLYLVQYARLTALAAYKCDNIDDIAASADIIRHIKEEMKMHVKYCNTFGISKSELDSGEESVACTVYTRYIESIGNARDWMSLQVALAACLVGYGEVGKRLYNDEQTDKTSLYWPWIQNYVDTDYSTAVSTGRALTEKHAVLQSPSKIAELVVIFKKVTQYEALFWTDAMDHGSD